MLIDEQMGVDASANLSSLMSRRATAESLTDLLYCSRLTEERTHLRGSPHFCSLYNLTFAHAHVMC